MARWLRLLLVCCGLAMSAAPAWACEFLERPSIYWEQPPAILEQGEVILEVEFVEHYVLRQSIFDYALSTSDPHWELGLYLTCAEYFEVHHVSAITIIGRLRISFSAGTKPLLATHVRDAAAFMSKGDRSILVGRLTGMNDFNTLSDSMEPMEQDRLPMGTPFTAIVLDARPAPSS